MSGTVKHFIISEDDLETLERALPCLQDAMMSAPDAINRKDIHDHLSMTKAILSNVRWNYGPPTQVENV